MERSPKIQEIQYGDGTNREKNGADNKLEATG